jgi:hypothetical protein
MAKSRLCSADLLIRGDSMISGTSHGRALVTVPLETYNGPPLRTFHFHEAPHGYARSDRSHRTTRLGGRKFSNATLRNRRQIMCPSNPGHARLLAKLRHIPAAYTSETTLFKCGAVTGTVSRLRIARAYRSPAPSELSSRSCEVR